MSHSMHRRSIFVLLVMNAMIETFAQWDVKMETSDVKFIRLKKYWFKCTVRNRDGKLGNTNPFVWESSPGKYNEGLHSVHNWETRYGPPPYNEINYNYEYHTSLVLSSIYTIYNKMTITCVVWLKGKQVAQNRYNIPLVIHPPRTPELEGPTIVEAGVEYTWLCNSEMSGYKAPKLYFQAQDGSIFTQGVSINETFHVDPYKYRMYYLTAKLTTSLAPTKALFTLKCHTEYTLEIYEFKKNALRNIRVICSDAPVVTKTGQDTILTVRKERIVIPCKVKACPDDDLCATTTQGCKHKVASVEWMYGEDYTLINVASSIYEGGTVDSPSLVIKSARLDHNTTFVCQATAVAGRGKFLNPTTLLVRYKPIIEEPSILEFRSDVGSSLTLPCKAHAYPEITRISWKRVMDGNISLINISGDARYSGGNLIQSQYDLRINPIQTTDADGIYFCETENEIGNTTSGPLTIVVPFLSTISIFVIAMCAVLLILFALLVSLHMLLRSRRLHDEEDRQAEKEEEGEHAQVQNEVEDNETVAASEVSEREGEDNESSVDYEPSRDGSTQVH